MVTFFIESAIGLTILYGFYHFFLKSGNDFRVQRMFLLSAGIISILIPLLNIRLPNDTILTSRQFLLFQEGYTDFTTHIDNRLSTQNPFINLSVIAITVYFIGVSFFLARLIYFIYKPLKIIHKYGIEKKGKLRFVYSDNIPFPFSIFNFIFLNRSVYQGNTLDEVIVHEKVHIAQRHTIDLIFVELLMVFLWFNPIVLIMKRSLMEIHEYLADEGVLKKGFNPDSYIGTILHHVSQKPISGLVSQFNSTTKKRIVMITNYNVKKKFKLSYLFILPVIALLFMAFSIDKNSRTAENQGIFSTTSSLEYILPAFQDGDVPSIWPVDKDKCRFTSGYGERIHPIYKKKMFHKGVDLAAEKGTPVKVTADGIVEKTEYWPEGYGNYIVITHNGAYTTLYAQLSEMNVKTGDKVKKGDVVGLVGSSGMSTAPHLHYEVRKDGEPVDPADYFVK